MRLPLLLRERRRWFRQARVQLPFVARLALVEGFVEFDYEITLLTIRHVGGTDFCLPIGHRQEGGDYQESWQPQPMTSAALEEAQAIATQVTDALGGWGLFGVEFFVKDDAVFFSEVSPRPHDTGMVTMISQDLSEFALHARAVLGLPISAKPTSSSSSYILSFSATFIGSISA